MAAFVKTWKEREKIKELLVQRSHDADQLKEREYNSALCIQCSFRGCRVRAYLAHLHDNAIIIQSHYRGYLGRAEHRRRLKKRLNVMRIDYYYAMATKIQSLWRGCHVRKFVFNYRTYRNYLNGLILKNEIVRSHLKEEHEKTEQEKALREEQIQELQTQAEARRHHYLLSTKVRDGVLKEPGRSSAHPLEDRMRSIKFAPPFKERLKRGRESVDTKSGPSPLFHGTQTMTTPLDGHLPPLVKSQGPFKPLEEVWRERLRPLNPSLRASSDYYSVDVARVELKAEEWRNRIFDTKLVPFSHSKCEYVPLLHTYGTYGTIPYGTHHFRERQSQYDISKDIFRNTVPNIETFDNLKA